jgi:hypothetical protein
VAAFWDEPSNRREFTSSEAQARYERRLATGGEAFWALPTDPRHRPGVGAPHPAGQGDRRPDL